MNTKSILFAISGALLLGGCSGMKVKNTGNSECEFRLHTDRERCLKNNRSNDEALETRKNQQRNARDSQAASAREGGDVAGGKQIP